MNGVYLLERRTETGLDETIGVVVLASNVKEARALASTKCGDEGENVWLDPELTSCRSVRSGRGKARVVLVSFRAG